MSANRTPAVEHRAPYGRRKPPAASVHETNAPSLLRARLGAELQKQRLRRGLTQGQLAEGAHLSLKYVGEIERGEANTTLDVLDRLAAILDWNPLDVFKAEPITEGVRVLLMTEAKELSDRLAAMVTWLRAIDPALDPAGRLRPTLPAPSDAAIPSRKRPRASLRR